MKSIRLIDNVEDWVGGIPKGWNRVPLKRIAWKLNRPTRPDDPIVVCTNKGKAEYRGEKSPGLVSLTGNGYQGVLSEDLLIHGMDTWHGAIAVSDISGQCTSVVHVCDSNENKRFLSYYLRALSFRGVYKAFSNGVRQNTSDFRSWMKAGEIPVVLPSLEAQRRIANYLDEKCAQIDRAIEAAEESIEELLRYRSSCLEETFNRLDGTYPKVKLKYVLEESKEKSVDGIGEPLSITIASGVLRSSELEIPNPASSMVGAKVVRAGDLVFNKLKAYFGVMYVSPYDGLISSEYAIYRALNPDALSLKYIEYLVHTNQIIDEFIIRISGVADGFRRLYTSDLFNISITLPPLRVQERAVRELNSLYDSVDASIAVKKSIIADLKAYKQSLIYEVVTGKRGV